MSMPFPNDPEALTARALQAQASTYGEGVDYVAGSPHLSHRQLHAQLVSRMRQLVDDAFAHSGQCRLLEVGGGHGTFTEELAAMGAEVTVTEISKPSAAVLSQRFRHSKRVRVVYDADGESIFDLPADFDIVLCVSVLHHIPDYLAFVRRLTPLLRPGGALAAYQDPNWYPRRRRLDNLADRGAYYAWRVTRGSLLSGARTQLRRMRCGLDGSLPADITEYHVLRQGVDELALADLLRADFGHVELFRYWSTQAAPLQRLGEKLRWRNTFGIEATNQRINDPGAT